MAASVGVNQLNPRLAAAHFQLYNLYRQAGRTEDAARELDVFQRLKKEAEGAAIAEDVDWCNYAEIYDPPVGMSAGAAGSTPAAQERVLEGEVDAATAGTAMIDSTGVGEADLLVWSSKGIALYRRGSELVKDSGLADVRRVEPQRAG